MLFVRRVDSDCFVFHTFFKSGGGIFVIWLSSSFSVAVLLLVFLFFVCLKFQIIRFVISTFTPVFFILRFTPSLPALPHIALPRRRNRIRFQARQI